MDERYISAELMTPKQRLVDSNPELKRELLLDSQQLKLLKTSYEQSPREFDDATETATGVAQLVRQTLDFAVTSSDSPLLNAENLANREATNCFGHVIVASECLEQIGIEHFVSYANQHAIITLFDQGSERAFLLDVATKELCFDITGAIGGNDPLYQLAAGKLRAVNTLYSTELMKHLPPSIDRERFIGSRPWLTFDDSDQARFREQRPADWMLQLLTLPSIPGRMLLIQQYNAARLADQGEIVAASEEFSELAGIYLDVDSRNDLKELDRLSKKLLQAEEYDRAIELAMMVEDSLVPGDTSKNRFFLPDTFRAVATRTQSKQLAEKALAGYVGLPNSRLRTGKITAARKLLHNL